jgi:hypothetical protein
VGSLGTAHLISLLLGLVAVAALGGFAAAAVGRRNKRRARGYFIAGLICGFLAGVALRRRSRGVKAFATIARRLNVHPPIVGIPRGAGRLATGALTFAASHARTALSPHWVRQLRN